ncbi:hypothetical protein JHD49_10500 [Sulfurimonas sp. SAG-AH-194-C21]|nr:hypothetical protein [Sulfurimonas sp. SAG-AH-194-C21]MDF1884371.1 hypothetical protein [Sulfurimonas sp. SAG-AH-194-C21]
MKTNFINLSAAALLTTLLSACGGGGGGSSDASTPTATPTTKTVQTVASVPTSRNTMLMVNTSELEGLKVSCALQDMLTQKDGSFNCTNFPIKVFLGSLEIGTLKNKTNDNIYYTQDIIGVNRGAIAHAEVTKISMILQSLDKDALPLNGITLTSNTVDLLNTLLVPNKKLQDYSFEDINYLIEDIIRLDKTQNKNSQLKAVSQEIAQSNLATRMVSLVPQTYTSRSAGRI